MVEIIYRKDFTEMDIIEEFYQSLPSEQDIGMYFDIKAFFNSEKNFLSYEIEKGSYQDYLITVKLYDFSVKKSKKIFESFQEFVSYKAVDMVTCIVNEQKVEFMYYTATNNGLSAKITVYFVEASDKT